ncbi:MAG: aminopeptidase, partial [Deltaproteobacteria bacterium]|nr:aminopeptidase [Deltaproteobacteria bacterium]
MSEDKKSKYADLAEKIGYTKKNVWDDLSKKETKAIFDFNDGYKQFLDSSKTERETVDNIIAAARKNGFLDLSDGKNNDGKYFYNYKNKVACLVRTVNKPLSAGTKIVAAHVDAPRLDLKQNPLYENTDVAFFKTHYYGGIKKNQWLGRPLAIHRILIFADGSREEIVIGGKDKEPGFTHADPLPPLFQKSPGQKKSEG